MIVTFRDVLGYVSVEVDQYGISFDRNLDGEIVAKFSDSATDYRVLALNLVSIQNQ